MNTTIGPGHFRLICRFACFSAFHSALKHAHICFKPFSIRLEAVFKQQNLYSNHEIHMPFEHLLRAVDVNAR